MNTRTGPRHEASALWAVERLEPRALLAAGALDATFGGGGLVTTDLLGRANTDGRAVAALDGGKFLVGGQASSGDGQSTFADAIVARYNADGTLDTSFGSGGRVAFDLGSQGAVVTELLVLPGGKFLVAGAANGTFVARFNADGTPDGSFGDGGFFRHPTTYTFSTRLALAPDGKVVGLTSFQVPGGSAPTDLLVFRLTTGGRLDASFGSGGTVVLSFGNAYETAGGIAVRPDGRVVGNAAWRDAAGGYNPEKVLIFQLTPGGRLDPTFADNGKVLGDLFGVDELRDLKLDAQGRVLILNDDTFGFSVARFRADGVFDRSFGQRGIARAEMLASPGAPSRTDVARLLLRPDGTTVAVGTTDLGNNSGPADRVVIGQFTPDGKLDPWLGQNGIARLARTGLEAAGAALLPDGRLLITGEAGNRAATARVTLAGALDTAFAPGGADGAGWVDLEAQTSAFQGGVDVAVQADGKMVVAGRTTDPDGTRPIVLRYLPNGQLDSTFGEGGVVRLELPDGYQGYTAGAVVTADGRIIVGGTQFKRDSSGASGGFIHWLDSTGKVVDGAGGTPRWTTTEGGVTALRLDAQGRLVFVEGGSGSGPVVHRATVSGVADETFSGDGRATLPTGFSAVRQNTLLFQPDGKILIGGGYDAEPDDFARQFAVLRLN
ncbi:MAG TPA: hypothetical protein VEA69_24205, partial [Tepidisphaeraceae bacterium]|nr:hypothetical protein [Tepidisphaeraceae bacterium]